MEEDLVPSKRPKLNHEPLTTIDYLPPEILILIFSYLTLYELFHSACQVNKKWRNCILVKRAKLIKREDCLFTFERLDRNISSLHIWTRRFEIDLKKEFGKRLPSPTLDLLQYVPARIAVLRLGGMAIDPKILSYLQDMCQSLQELELTFPRFLDKHLSPFRGITTVVNLKLNLDKTRRNIDGIPSLADPSENDRKNGEWPSLQQLYLEELTDSFLNLQASTMLTRLVVERVDIQPNFWTSLVSLRSLSISNCTHVRTSISLTSLTNLQTLRFCSPNLFNPFAYPLKFSDSISNLDLSYLSFNDQSFALTFSSPNGNIRSLILRGCTYLTTPPIATLFPNLQQLDICGTTFSLEYIQLLIHGLHNLITLAYQGDGNKRGLKALAKKYHIELASSLNIEP